MKKPGDRYPSAAGSFGSMAPGILPDPGLNDVHFSELIKNRGMKFTHHRAIPCPNVQDNESMIHVNHCTHPNCFNGMLYIQPNVVWGYFNNDQLNKLYEIQGEYNENIAIITMSATYEDGTQCDLGVYDLLESSEYSKRTYELIEYNPAGIDRLKYYAIDTYVLTLHDREFVKDVDFTILDGKIKWISNNRPGYNQQSGRGQIYSIGYYIRPTFFVHHVMKELRATQVVDPMTGEKIAVRLPQHIMCLRELLYPDTKDETGDQTSKMPRFGMLPPR